MIEEGIQNRAFAETDLKHFQKARSQTFSRFFTSKF